MLIAGRHVTVNGNNVREQVEALRHNHPTWYDRIDCEKAEAWARKSAAERGGRDDFGPEEAGGRGGSYLRAQAINVQARAIGIAELFRLIRNGPGKHRVVVDLLGGDGHVRRVCALLGLTDVDIITCDASPHMVSAAWADDLPALLQRAQWPLFRSASVDAVLLAYGTHHIKREERASVVRNAFNILQSAGVLVLHDFAAGSPMDTWFSQVVHPWSATGHNYDHFTADEINAYLMGAGFDFHEVIEIDDPYVAVGDTSDEAELRLGEYLVNMYGLVRLREKLGDRAAFLRAVDIGKEIFRYSDSAGLIKEYRTQDGTDRDSWRVTLPRKAIVGIGRKA